MIKKNQRIVYNCLFIVLFIIQILVSNIVLGQQKVQVTNWAYKTYTPQDGFTSATINKIFYDSTGYLWLVAENGVSKFDGYEFRNFKDQFNNPTDFPTTSIVDFKVITPFKFSIINNNEIWGLDSKSKTYTKLYTNETGDLKQGTYIFYKHSYFIIKKNEIEELNILTGKSSHYKFSNTFETASIEFFTIINNKLIAINNKELISFDCSTFRINKTSLHQFNFNRQLKISYLSNQSNLLLLYDGFAFWKYDEIQLVFNKTFDVTINQSSFTYSKVSILDNNTLAVLDKNSIKIVDFKNKLHSNINLSNFAYHVKGRSQIYYDATDSCITVTSQIGCFFYYLNSKKAEVLNSKLFYNNRVVYINDILKNNHVFWLSIPGQGILKGERIIELFNKQQPINVDYISERNIGNNIRAIEPYNNEKIILSSLNGAHLFNLHTEKFESFNLPSAENSFLTSTPISCIKNIDNTQFIISLWNKYGLYRLNLNSKKITKLKSNIDKKKILEQTARTMLLDSKGRLWIGSDDGKLITCNLKYLKNDSLIMQIEPTKVLLFNNVFCIKEHTNGDIYIATNKGLLVYQTKENKYISYTSYQNKPYKISSNNIRSICFDKSNNVWIGSAENGLNKIELATKNITHYNTSNGLPDNAIYSIALDNNNLLWMGTNKGLCAIDTNLSKIYAFTIQDGVQSYEFNTNAVLKVKNTIILGGINGINYFEGIPKNTKILSKENLILNDFIVNNTSKPFIQNEPVILKHDENNVVFQFANLSYFKNKEIKYAFKLKGWDKEWNYGNSQRNINYLNLPAGSYAFMLKSSNIFGIWGAEKQMVSFKITIPFWRSNLFYLLIGALILGIFYLLYLIRINQLKEILKLRTDIAKDLHDEVGSNLSNISLFNQVALLNVNKNNFEPISPILHKIATNIQYSQQALNDIVWMLNHKNDTIENLNSRVNQFAAELFEAKQITFHSQIELLHENQKLSTLQRKNIYLILKESINNIVKYANCKNVYFDIIEQEKKVLITLKDDGIGFTKIKSVKGNGLDNIKHRADEIKAALAIETGIGQGVKIKITINL